MQVAPTTINHNYKMVMNLEEIPVETPEGKKPVYRVIITNGAGTYFGVSDPTPDIEEAVRAFERIQEHLERAVDNMVKKLGLHTLPDED